MTQLSLFTISDEVKMLLPKVRDRRSKLMHIQNRWFALAITGGIVFLLSLLVLIGLGLLWIVTKDNLEVAAILSAFCLGGGMILLNIVGLRCPPIDQELYKINNHLSAPE